MGVRGEKGDENQTTGGQTTANKDIHVRLQEVQET
jgi:hypothetical protein